MRELELKELDDYSFSDIFEQPDVWSRIRYSVNARLIIELAKLLDADDRESVVDKYNPQPSLSSGIIVDWRAFSGDIYIPPCYLEFRTNIEGTTDSEQLKYLNERFGDEAVAAGQHLSGLLAADDIQGLMMDTFEQQGRPTRCRMLAEAVIGTPEAHISDSNKIHYLIRNPEYRERAKEFAREMIRAQALDIIHNYDTAVEHDKLRAFWGLLVSEYLGQMKKIRCFWHSSQ